MTDEIECLISFLEGTDKTIHEVADELGLDVDEFYRSDDLDHIYKKIDQCDGCNTWCDIRDMMYLKKQDLFYCKDCVKRLKG